MRGANGRSRDILPLGVLDRAPRSLSRVRTRRPWVTVLRADHRALSHRYHSARAPLDLFLMNTDCARTCEGRKPPPSAVYRSSSARCTPLMPFTGGEPRQDTTLDG